MELTTPMMEESNWTSARRRSSAAFRMTSLESESPSFLANDESSILRFLSVKKVRVREWRGREGVAMFGL